MRYGLKQCRELQYWWRWRKRVRGWEETRAIWSKWDDRLRRMDPNHHSQARLLGTWGCLSGMGHIALDRSCSYSIGKEGLRMRGWMGEGRQLNTPKLNLTRTRDVALSAISKIPRICGVGHALEADVGLSSVLYMQFQKYPPSLNRD